MSFIEQCYLPLHYTAFLPKVFLLYPVGQFFLQKLNSL